MSQHENPPFLRGETFFGVGGTTDATSGAQWEGKVYTFRDLSMSAATPEKPDRTTAMVTTMICRNVGAAALLPKRLVTLAAGKVGQVDGYGRLTAAYCIGAVDEWLPTAGVPVNDLFHVIIKGPCTLLTDIAAAVGNVINQGDFMIALTAATSGATTAGRAQVYPPTTADFSVTQNATFAMQANRIGFALSAMTTNSTNTGVLSYLVKNW